MLVHMNATALRRLTVCCLALLAPAAFLPAQETTSFTGYTRPGFPNDTRSGDKIIWAADDPNLKDKAIGGTVYFTVLQLTKQAGDSWTSGVPKFNSRFKPGIDFAGASSPELDTGAKYLYLYQVVNDRQTTTPIWSV